MRTTAQVSTAYLRLSDPYADEQQRATASGMPTASLDLGHFGLLRDPEPVAVAVLELVDRL